MSDNQLVKPKTNLPKALSEIEALKSGLGDLIVRINANLVKSEEEYNLAIQQGKESDDAIKKIKRTGDEKIAPAKSFVDKVKDAVKAIVVSIEGPQDGLRERCAAYQRKVREAQAKEIARLESQKQKTEAKALEADTAKQQVALLNKSEKIEAKIETVAAEKPKAATRRRTFEITDVNLIPRKYLIPDETKIRKAGGGVTDPIRTDIPGVRFYDDEKVSFG
jgi:hypothetical protein